MTSPRAGVCGYGREGGGKPKSARGKEDPPETLAGA
jgi:hypothetical protein